MFTNVPIDGAVEAALRKLENDPSLADRTTLTPAQITDLLTFVLRSTYFQYNGSIYEQQEGAAMGSPVSAVIANLYMESFEEQAITSSSYTPKRWKRYVDDTFTILDRENVDSFLQHLNIQQPSIRFTMETENDSNLAFLDTAVSREPDGRLATSKITKTRKPSTNAEPATEFKSTAVLPHVTGLSEQLRRCLQQQGVRAVFKSETTLRSHLVRPKDAVDSTKQDGVVYRIPCECGKVYIGETGRPMQDRIIEHDRDIRLARIQTSAVAEHTNNTGHYPLWNKVKFIDRDPHWYKRRVKEVIHIRLHPNNINRDNGIEIPEAWMPTIKKKKKKKHNNRRTVRQRTAKGTTGHRNGDDRNAPITAVENQQK
ncbi:hypothetical protein ACROYT_G006910 [Oculina patagonica]